MEWSTDMAPPRRGGTISRTSLATHVPLNDNFFVTQSRAAQIPAESGVWNGDSSNLGPVLVSVSFCRIAENFGSLTRSENGS